MSERQYLDDYDPAAFERPSVTVDLVLLTLRDDRLMVLMQRRADHPFKGQWALPGGFVRMEESLDAAAERVQSDKVGLPSRGWLEQLYSFGAPDRDPRMRIITIAYFALLPATAFDTVLDRRDDLELYALDIAADGTVQVLAGEEGALPLAFDHLEIVKTAVERLRGKLDYSRIAFSLLPDRFTLRDLQQVHETILGTSLNKPAFRRRMLDKGWIEGTGEREAAGAYRPAELFRLKG